MTVSAREELERRAHAGDGAAQLALADMLDADGRHREAIDVLALAAKAGNVAAKGRIGARVLVGDRAPAVPAKAVNVIAEAAREGDGASAALLAALTAAGAYRRQDWAEALDWLQRAAERGHDPARGQLAVLTPDRALAEEARDPGEAAADLWARLRGSVDVRALLAAPPAETLHESPLIRRFASFASPATCDWLIARARGRLERAEIYAEGAGDSRTSDVRTNSAHVFSLADTDLVQLALQARMAAAVGVPFSHMEAAAVLHYGPGEEFSDHYDFIDARAPAQERHLARYGQRIMTFLVYLNDGYEGGETAFPRLGLSHAGCRGEGLALANVLESGAGDERTLHAGRPPGRGEKWIASQFIRARPVVPGASP